MDVGCALMRGGDMDPSSDPRASAGDLTAKARIRNAAMDLYAEFGEDRTSMRTVASTAGVTVGLVVHHFKNKDGLRDAVEELIVEHFSQAIAQAPADGEPRQVMSARDAAVERMLAAHPEVVNYLRRALLDPAKPTNSLIDRLTTLSRSELRKVREAGLAPSDRRESAQVVDVIVRQFGQLFLQPLVDSVWERVSSPEESESESEKPKLMVAVRNSVRTTTSSG